jgi:hypothetical protein
LGLSCSSAAIQFGVLLLIASNYFAAADGSERLWRMRDVVASQMMPLTFEFSLPKGRRVCLSQLIECLVWLEAR